MELDEIIRLRQSIRSFLDRSVHEGMIKTILNAANRAPSAGNLQAYQMFVVLDRKILEQLSRAALNQEFISQASFAIIFCADPERSAVRYRDRGRQLYSIQDATIAGTFAMLAATSLGLGSVWVGAFDEDAVRTTIGASSNIKPVLILPIGYPAEDPDVRPRRDLSDIVVWR